MSRTLYDDDVEEWEPIPDGPRRGTRVLAVFALVVVAALLAVGAVFVWYQRQVSPGGAGAAVAVTVPKGSTASDIAGLLSRKGIIGNTTAFRLYVKLNKRGPFRSGSYTLRRNAGFGPVSDALEKGPAIRYTRLTIPEGLTLAQVAAKVGQLPGRSADRFLELARSGAVRSPLEPDGSNDLEGLLFPDTYQIERGADERKILERMVDQMATVTAEMGIESARPSPSLRLTPYQMVVVASLVEREARRDQDRGPVARVIYNRLEQGIPLGIDATILYGLGRTSGELRKSELAKDTPYNTRIRKGLVPTPIAMPGRAVLEAAIHPPPGDALFYVTINDCTGETVFARTNAEHERNKARRARENC